jgi:heme/copper-type cytochrome/quinol oxidase subunit 2
MFMKLPQYSQVTPIVFDQATAVTLDTNGTALAHDFTIGSIGGQKVNVKAQPNGKATGQFTPTAAGMYQFYCAEPGYQEACVVGTLTVT